MRGGTRVCENLRRVDRLFHVAVEAARNRVDGSRIIHMVPATDKHQLRKKTTASCVPEGTAVAKELRME